MNSNPGQRWPGSFVCVSVSGTVKVGVNFHFGEGTTRYEIWSPYLVIGAAPVERRFRSGLPHGRSSPISKRGNRWREDFSDLWATSGGPI